MLGSNSPPGSREPIPGDWRVGRAWRAAETCRLGGVPNGLRPVHVAADRGHRSRAAGEQHLDEALDPRARPRVHAWGVLEDLLVRATPGRWASTPLGTPVNRSLSLRLRSPAVPRPPVPPRALLRRDAASTASRP